MNETTCIGQSLSLDSNEVFMDSGRSSSTFFHCFDKFNILIEDFLNIIFLYKRRKIIGEELFFEYCDKNSILQPSGLRLLLVEDPSLTQFPCLLFPVRPLSFEDFKNALKPASVSGPESREEVEASKLAVKIEADILLGLEGLVKLKEPFVDFL